MASTTPVSRNVSDLPDLWNAWLKIHHSQFALVFLQLVVKFRGHRKGCMCLHVWPSICGCCSLLRVLGLELCSCASHVDLWFDFTEIISFSNFNYTQIEANLDRSRILSIIWL